MRGFFFAQKNGVGLGVWEFPASRILGFFDDPMIHVAIFGGDVFSLKRVSRIFFWEGFGGYHCHYEILIEGCRVPSSP